MIVIDASVWISGMVSADALNHSSTAWLNRTNEIGLKLVVPAHFPAEVVGVLQRTAPGEHILEDMIETLFDPDFFDIRQITLELARLSAKIAVGSAIRGSDAINVALAAMLDLPLVTWDRQQRERGALFCRTMTPVEAMEMTE